MLKVLNGLLKPSKGKYLFDNIDVYDLSSDEVKLNITQKIGFVWQDYRLIPDITVMNNIILPSLIYNKKVDNKYLDELLEFLGITKYKSSYVSELSGGEQQRVALARAMVLKPSVIIADEPTGALDSKTSKQLIDLLIKINAKFNTLCIIATHDDELSRIGNKRIEILDGEVINYEELEDN